MRRFPSASPALVAAIVATVATAASIKTAAAATTYEVGPGKAYPNVNAIADQLKPGDVVLVQGGASYPAVDLEQSGAPAAKITIRGVPVNGKRPTFKGGVNTIHVSGNHWVLEGLDVTGGSSRCFFQHGDDVTLRDSVVHDCPNHGILGADTNSGSFTMQYVEVTKSGYADRHHPIYMSSDQRAYPGSVFRMEHCYVHDNVGGNNIKSRAERNEIYYNWVEGATYHEIELIGPEEEDPTLKREDSDVVGNVFVQTSGTFMVRVGGDGGGGNSNGRVRFANNTFVANNGNPLFRLWDGLESLEIHNNVFYGNGRPVTLVDSSRVRWASGQALIAGSNNWVPTNSALVPSQLQNTVSGADPRFVAADKRDVRVAEGSPLANAGNPSPQPVAGRPVPSALAAPAFLPPLRTLEKAGAARRRSESGRPSIGAYDAPKAEPVDAPAEEATAGDAPAQPAGDPASAGPDTFLGDAFQSDFAAPYRDHLVIGGCSMNGSTTTRSGLSASALVVLGLVLGRARRRKQR